MFSDPISGKDFFGREEVLELLKKRVEAFNRGYRQNVALIGHQKIGKTSILHHFLGDFKDESLLMIYVELKPQALDCFIDQFVRSILFQFLVQKEHVSSMESFDVLIEKADHYIPQTVNEIRMLQKSFKKGDSEAAYNKVLELATQITHETGKKCIIVLDEFHRLGNFAVKHPFQNFGKRIMVQKDVLYILSSSSFTASKRILAEKLSLLFGNFEQVHLEPFSFDVANKYIMHRLDPIEIPEDLCSYLVAITDGHPFYLNVILKQLKHACLIALNDHVNKELFVSSLQTLLFNAEGVLHQYFLNMISMWMSRLKGNHLLLLIHLANGNNKVGDLSSAIRKSATETTKQLKELIGEELIIKNGVFYHFHDKLLQFWIRFVYQPKEFSLHIDANSKSSEFYACCMEHINEFSISSQKKPNQRIMQLFKKFRNELVEIDSRGRYLPAFEDIQEVCLKENPHKEAIVAKTQGQCWVCAVQNERSTDKDVLDFIQQAKKTHPKASKQVIFALNGMDHSAKLLAKNKKVWTLNLHKVNTLMDFYGQTKIISLKTPDTVRI